MAEKIEYKGYKIVADSYQDSEVNLWVPRAMIFPMDEAQNTEMPMSWAREFETQLKADDFALEGARLYIDEFF